MAIYLGNLKVNATAGTTGSGGSGTTVEALNVTSNGTYSAPTGTAYSPVTVSVPTLSASAITLTENGVYSAPTGYAYSPITVSVSGGGGSADYLDVRAALSSSYYSTASTIGMGAFACAYPLWYASLPNLLSIPQSAFMNCDNLKQIDAPNVSFIGYGAFSRCGELEYASFPLCTTVNDGFYYCNRMSFASFPILTQVNGFSNCSSMTTFYAPLAVSVATYGFYNDRALTSVTLSSCCTLGQYAFYYCSSLSEINLPMAYRGVGSNAFASCSSLSTVKLGSSTTSTSTSQIVYPSAFRNCTHLLSLYLYNSTMWGLSNINAFNSTPISTYTTSTGGVNGSIFVPASLVDTYKSATNWATYSDRIASIPAEVVL